MANVIIVQWGILPTYRPIYLPTYLSTYLPTYYNLLSYLPTFIFTSLSTHPPTRCLHTERPYMDVTMAIFPVFLRYKKINKIRSIEIIKKGSIYLKLS
jgi:hypothetical protein